MMTTINDRRRAVLSILENQSDGDYFEYDGDFFIKTPSTTSKECMVVNIKTGIARWMLKTRVVIPLEVEIVLHK